MIRRSLDFGVNSKSPFMWFNFFVINSLMRREVLQRRRYPLGDESFEEPLLKVGDAPPYTVSLTDQGASGLACVESA
jgi:hypothetical protein